MSEAPCKLGYGDTEGASINGRLSLFVFIDALGWELACRHRFLEGLAPHGRPLETVLGYSSACDPTILTGRLPRDHGHFSFFRFDPAASPFAFLKPLAFVPPFFADRARVRNRLSRAVQARLGYTGYFQLYAAPFKYLPLLDYTEKRDIYEAGGINGGHPTVFDHMRESGYAFHLSDWRRPEVENVAAARAVIRQANVGAVYLYLAELDGIMHAAGTNSESVSRKLSWYERQIGDLVSEARGRYEDVGLHVFSDHGMTDVSATSDLAVRIGSLGYRFGTDYAAVFDSTMARFWFGSDAARQAITDVLSGEDDGRILSPSELMAFGCDFEDDLYGELFFLLDPGVILCPSFMGRRPVKGMHGYDPTHRSSTAAYMSNRPLSERPRHLADLYDLILSETGVRQEQLVT